MRTRYTCGSCLARLAVAIVGVIVWTLLVYRVLAIPPAVDGLDLTSMSVLAVVVGIPGALLSVLAYDIAVARRRKRAAAALGSRTDKSCQ